MKWQTEAERKEQIATWLKGVLVGVIVGAVIGSLAATWLTLAIVRATEVLQ